MEKRNIYPIEAFHPNLQEIIKNIAIQNDIAVDQVSSFALVAIGFSLLNNYEIEVKYNWVERSNLFVLYIGISGTQKSPIFNAILKPIRKDLNKRMKESFALKESQHLQYKAALKKNGELHGVTNKDEILDWCEKNFGSRIAPQNYPGEIKPCFTQGTFEKLSKNLSTDANNGRALIINYDEFSGFIRSLNQYRKGADEETLLKLFSYEGMDKDNMNKESSSSIEEQNVCIAGTSQPELLFEIVSKERLINGQSYRFLFTFDEKDYDENPENIPNVFKFWKFEGTNPYEEFYKILNNFLEGYEYPIRKRDVLVLNDEIRDYLREWRKQINMTKANKGDDISTRELIGIYGKMDMYIFRLAIILNRVRKYYENDLNSLDLSVDDFKNSAKLIDYYVNNTVRVINDVRFTKRRFMKNNKEYEFFCNLPDNFSYKDFVKEYMFHMKMSEPTAVRRLKEWFEEYKIVGKFKSMYYKK
jgi:hypothetical protein